MTTGFRNSSGADLDTLFMAGSTGVTGYPFTFQAYVTGATQADCGFRNSAGTDLSQLFQNINVPLFTLTNPTPGGSATAYGVVPGSANGYAKPQTDGQILGYGIGYVAFGSPTGGTVAAGKYWKWNYVSGSTPTSGTVAENTWTPVGTGQVNMARSGTVGTRTGTVAISFANDSGGGGATTGGNWVLTAVIEN